jgi:hypothetical protein
MKKPFFCKLHTYSLFFLHSVDAIGVSMAYFETFEISEVKNYFKEG